MLAYRVLCTDDMARQHKAPGTDDNYSVGTDDNYSVGTDDNYSLKSGSERLSVMDWLLAIGHAAARKLRGVPVTPIVRLYPKA